jgi:flagellar motor switch protein FliN/FliY
MTTATETKPNFDVLLDLPVDISIVLGQTRLPMRDVLQLHVGSVVTVEQPSNAPVDLFANEKLVARGEIVVIDDQFALKITELAGKRT